MIPRSRLVLAAILAAAGAPTVSAEVRSRTDRTPAPPRASLAGVPVSFEANRGQVDPEARFLARARGFRAFLLDAGAVFAFPGGGAVRMEFQGSRPGTVAIGELPLAARSHYLLGNDPSKWVRDVPHCGRVTAPDLYPGVSLRWRPAAGRLLEYDLVLSPGADPESVRMRFEGADALEVDASGELLVKTPSGVLVQGRPAAWQEGSGGREPVAAAFALTGDGRVGFRIGRFDPARPLVVDPVIQYASYNGSGSFDDGIAVAADSSRAAYILGQTSGTTYPVKSAYQGSYQGGNQDMFLAKVAPDGASLVYATYLGGGGDDYATGVTVDALGAAHVTGYTDSSNYPVANPVQGTKPSANAQSGVVTKLSAAGNTLVWSTYLGGNAQTFPAGIVLDSAGAAVVVGSTVATNLPMVSAIQASNAGGYDGFVVRFAPAGNAISWSTYLGGGSTDDLKAVALDSAGGIYLTGMTQSSNFPLANAYQGTLHGTRDAFVTKLAAGGTSVVYSTYLGGTAQELGYGIAVDSQGAAWVGGGTTSTDFPVASPVQATNGGGNDAFIAKLSAQGNTLLVSTYLGGTGNETPTAVALAPGGGIWIGGTTTSTDLAVVDALSGSLGGSLDGFLACLPASGQSILTLGYVGGSQDDFVHGLAVDGAGSLLVVGTSSSAEFPASGTFQPTKAGGSDAFILRLQSTLYAPTNCKATPTGLTKVLVTWDESNADESGFVLERSVDGAGFEERATLGPDTVEFLETGLIPATAYAWRVRAFRGLTVTAPSNTDTLTTPPTPVSAPAAPSGLEVSVATARSVDLSWQDNSDDEDFFIVARATGPSLYATVATPVLGSTSYADATVLPGRTYSYKVLAYNPVGNSLDSNIVTLTMPSTLGFALVQGIINDSANAGRDTVSLKGTFGFGEEAQAAAFDSALLSFSLRLGDYAKPPLVDIAAGDEGWKVRKGVHTWRSPRGSLVKAKIVVRPATGEFSVKLTRLTLAAPPASPVHVTVGIGTDSGFAEDPWTPGRRAGQLRFP